MLSEDQWDGQWHHIMRGDTRGPKEKDVGGREIKHSFRLIDLVSWYFSEAANRFHYTVMITVKDMLVLKKILVVISRKISDNVTEVNCPKYPRKIK